MEPALWAAKTGLDAQQTQMTVTANNLANVNTTGFKASRAVFEDLLYQNVTQVGANTSQTTQSPTGLQLGTGVRVVATETDLHPGQPQPDRQLARSRHPGPRLLPGAAAQTAPSPTPATAASRPTPGPARDRERLPGAARASPFRPARRASRSAPTARSACSSPASPHRRPVGTLQLADFINPAGLQTVGGNLLGRVRLERHAHHRHPGLTGLGTLVQGSLESSNVNVVEEMVNMIETQRAYEMNSKAVQTTDQMLQYAAQNM